jgi:Domain of unknown function (DUF4386)
MNKKRKVEIVLGILFLLAIFLYLPGTEKINNLLNDPDFSGIDNQLLIGVLVELITVIAITFLATLIFPIFKKNNEKMAIVYSGFRIFEAILLLVFDIGLLSIIFLNEGNALTGTIGKFLTTERFLTSEITPYLVNLSGLVLCYILYKSKLIPRFISLFGTVGYVVMLIGFLLMKIGYDIGYLKGVLAGLFELTLAIWLIMKGFNSPKIDKT